MAKYILVESATDHSDFYPKEVECKPESLREQLVPANKQAIRKNFSLDGDSMVLPFLTTHRGGFQVSAAANNYQPQFIITSLNPRSNLNLRVTYQLVS